jgi:protein O-mannosyl-transferase
MAKTGKLFPFLIFSLVILGAYLPSFSGDFILDDVPLIKSNIYIREWHSLGSYLSQEDGCDSNSGDAHTGYYRPLINLSYISDYKIWGLNAPGFRVTNLILHLFVCLALFCFYKLIFKQRDIALWLSLIFALHPITTESVSWVASRNNLLTTLFGILSFIFYIKAYEKMRFIYYPMSVLFFGLSVFSKEFGLMLLPILFLYQRTLGSKKTDFKIELREYLPYIIICALYFFFRHNTIGSLLSPSGFADFFPRLFYVPFIMLFNIRLIFLPYNMHSYIIERPNGYISTGNVCGILFLVLAVYLLLKNRKNKLFIFSVFAFLLAIFPASGLIPTSAPSLIAMRWLYYPMIFILTIMAKPFEYLLKSKKWIALTVVGVFVMYLGVNSYVLNEYLWHSRTTFFKQEVLNFDNKYYAGGLAWIYSNNGNDKLAEKYFKKNLECGASSQMDYIGYAIILLKKGEAKKSLPYLEKAETYHLLTTSQLCLILNTRGSAYLKLNKLNSALKEFKKAIVFNNKDALSWENAGIAYGEMGDHVSAVDSFKKATKYGLTSTSVLNNLALAYVLNNECQKAITLLDRKGFRDQGNAKELLERAKKCSNRIS